jgi:hypothetical protein
MQGPANVPRDLWIASEQANRRDYHALASEFAAAGERIMARDATALARRERAIRGEPAR